ncbi:unnamed protein product [marine sediment metagenome]|uniref:Uncharacterized protein n=1 Tax=marine sediment metagenome TaxID=412755 RepID=X0VST3_9ZZZZ
MDNYKDFGWANGWMGVTPELVEACREARHKHEITNENRTTEHVVKCHICKYIYRIDSS